MQAQIAEEEAQALARTEEIERLNRQIERKRQVLESQMTVLRSEFEEEEEEIKKRMAEVEARRQAIGRPEKPDGRCTQGRRGDKADEKLNTERTEEDRDFWQLRLYVAGQTPKSLTAFANLKKICEEHLAGKYRIEIIDLLGKPHPCQGRSDPRHPHPREETP